MSKQQLPEFAFDTANLYRETIISDRQVGTLTQLTPITPSGEIDTSRQEYYVGQSQLYTPAGALPISADIEANNLQDALAKFPAAMREALESTLKELEELRRQSASQIVLPGAGGGMGGLGGLPGGGKIQIP